MSENVEFPREFVEKLAAMGVKCIEVTLEDSELYSTLQFTLDNVLMCRNNLSNVLEMALHMELCTVECTWGYRYAKNERGNKIIVGIDALYISIGTIQCISTPGCQQIVIADGKVHYLGDKDRYGCRKVSTDDAIRTFKACTCTLFDWHDLEDPLVVLQILKSIIQTP